MSTLPSGDFQIFSCVGNLQDLPIGVETPQSTYPVTVRVDEPVNTWAPDRIGEGVYMFSVGNYRYTGGRPSGSVVASNYYQTGTPWYISYQKDQDAYTISLDALHDTVWTISSSSGSPTVDLRPLRLPVEPWQLFKFQPLPE